MLRERSPTPSLHMFQRGRSKGYDVVFHNECFADVKDPAFLREIVAEHEQGTPAVLMHCAMHCYRAGTDEWFRFCDVTSSRRSVRQPSGVSSRCCRRAASSAG